MIKQKRDFKRMLIEQKKRKEEELIRQQKEKAEREARNESLSCISSGVELEIPEQLERMLANLDNLNLNRSERNIHKLTAEQQFNFKLSKSQLKPLPSDIDQYAFSKFTNIYFNSHVWAMRKEPIKTAFLLKNSNFEVKQSRTLFKLVLRFMNDHTLTELREKIFLDFIINSVLKHDYLRDELLCQLCNQTWKNENPINANRGWLLLINCLSAFSPSPNLFKYLLKYLSDQAADYRGLLQQKLLNCDGQVRKYPPTYLEWVANGRKANMSLNVTYPNNERKYCEVSSWSTGESIANDLLVCKGINDSFGWSVDLEQESQLNELNGEEFVFDLINEVENPLIPNYGDFYIYNQFENGDGDLLDVGGLTNGHLSNGHIDKMDNLSLNKLPNGNESNHIQRHHSLGSINEQVVLSKNSKLNKRYLKEDLESKELESLKFSETSKLNKRYTTSASASNSNNNSQLSGQSRKDDQSVSKPMVSGMAGVARKLNKQLIQQQSMSNLIDIKNSSLSKRSLSLQELGLATKSALNDRYFDKSANQSNSLTRKELKQSADLSSSNSSIVSASSYQAAGASSKSVKPKVMSYNNLSDLNKTKDRSGNSQLTKSSSSYWYKEKFKHQQSTSNYLNVKHHHQKVPSSAMSDISETASLAPSLASHVKGIKLPSHASELDIDVYLDHLFNPVLDGNLDELSDARSLAASIKGGGASVRLDEPIDESIDSIQPKHIKKLSFEEFKQCNLLSKSANLCQLIKGGGSKDLKNLKEPKIVTNTHTFSSEAAWKAQQKSPPTINTNPNNNQSSNSATSAFTNVAGMTLPMVDTSQIIQQQLVHEQMIQRKFLASAVQQNLQIQQQLFKQNQALQQLLCNNSFASPELATTPGSLSDPSSLVNSGLNSNLDASSTEASLFPIPLLQTVPQLNFLDDLQLVDDKATENDRKEDSKRPNEKIKIISNKQSQSTSSVPPPVPPPMPTHLNLSPSMAYNSRAKTVRIGKVRWPPSREAVSRQEGDGCETKSSNYTSNQTLKLNESESIINDLQTTPSNKERVKDDLINASSESKSKQVQSTKKSTPVNNLVVSSMKEEKLIITELRTDLPKTKQQNAMNMSRSLSTNGINHQHPESRLITNSISNSNVGKLRISSEMKAKLELLTINQSVRSTVKSSNHKNDLMAKSMENLQDIRENSQRVNKLSKERKSLLEKQLLGQFEQSKGGSVDNLSASNGQLNASSSKKLASGDLKNEFKFGQSSKQHQNYSRESRERMDELGIHKLNKLTKMNQSSSASLGALNFCYDCKKNEESNCKFYCRERLEYDQLSASMCNIADLANQQLGHSQLNRKFANETLFGENLDSGQFLENANYLKKEQHLNGHTNGHHPSTDQSTDEQIKLNTKLYPLNKSYLTYQKVPWELRLRKELFSPTERIESPMVLGFIFLQIVRDAYSSNCLRMRPDEKQSIIKHLESIGVNKQNYLTTVHKLTVQKAVVQMARQMPLYFSRYYSIINCKNYPYTNQLAVSHSGLRLVRRGSDEIKIMETILFEEIVEITSSKENHIQILGKNKTWIHLISDKVSEGFSQSITSSLSQLRLITLFDDDDDFVIN